MFISRKRYYLIEEQIKALETCCRGAKERIALLEKTNVIYDQGPHIPGFSRLRTDVYSVVCSILDHLKLTVRIKPEQGRETQLWTQDQVDSKR